MVGCTKECRPSRDRRVRTIARRLASSPSLARLAAAYRYLYYSDRIDGWMYQTTALAMMELLWLQEEAGFVGNTAEIGVHHGCSALALIAASRPEETMIAIDVFDRSEERRV